MNPTGSEFTLRVAICDLVERLKRMQHKCTYLEECRNQLVKEVIRLRLQNEWLAKQISDSPGASASLPTQHGGLPSAVGGGGGGGGHSCFCGQQTAPSQQQHQLHQLTHHQQSSLEGGNSGREVDHLLCMNHHHPHHHSKQQHSTGSNNSSQKADESLHLMNILSQFEAEDLENKQDSIKNLTIQMLKDLETEMKTGRLKSDLIQFVKHSQDGNGADLFTDKVSDDLMKFDDDEMMMVDNHGQATTTKLTTGGGGGGTHSTSSANYEAFNNNSDYYSNSHNLNIAAFEDLQLQIQKDGGADSLLNQSATVGRGGRTAGGLTELSLLDEDNPTIKMGGSGGRYNGDKLEEAGVGSIYDLKSLKDEEVIGILAALHKIKSRQLRYYFQKQINLDSAGGGGGGTGGGGGAISKSSSSKSQQQQSIPIPGNAFGGSSNSSLK
ncbi:hypothetical protein TYRP_000589 [Tyrophagus putrescentiae]|nr:hypothetical protein TYRP_000589 [Tyrophagus putrescentiae]